MKQKTITAVLLSAIIAFAISSWGRIAEFWQDKSIIVKILSYMVGWVVAMFVGLHYGKEYALFVLLLGVLGIVLMAILTVNRILKDVDEMK